MNLIVGLWFPKYVFPIPIELFAHSKPKSVAFAFRNNQRHLFEKKKIEQKKERGSASGAGDLPGCQLEANCPGPEDCGLSKY